MKILFSFGKSSEHQGIRRREKKIIHFSFLKENSFFLSKTVIQKIGIFVRMAHWWAFDYFLIFYYQKIFLRKKLTLFVGNLENAGRVQMKNKSSVIDTRDYHC